jgi:hypothetical protein
MSFQLDVNNMVGTKLAGGGLAGIEHLGKKVVGAGGVIKEMKLLDLPAKQLGKAYAQPRGDISAMTGEELNKFKKTIKGLLPGGAGTGAIQGNRKLLPQEFNTKEVRRMAGVEKESSVNKELIMSLNSDIEKRAMQKMAGISDTLRSAFDYITGQYGQLPAGAYGAMGAGIGAAAGHGMGMPGMLAGAAMGGLGGYGTANAINQQGTMQNTMDSAMIGGVGAGFGANDQTDMMQDQQLQQHDQMLGNIMGYLGGGEQAAAPGGENSVASAGQQPTPNLNGLGQPDQQGYGANTQERFASAEDTMINEILRSVL